ncbi:hypothetical protein VpaJT1_39 [Vibrio phage VpaJT_1]|nr:hypothetical protein VpaJT1_39 [Vibrio phage VpaJT_1]
MARQTLTDLINAINAVIIENTTGAITATQLNQLLQTLTNNLYLPTVDTITVDGTGGVSELVFDGGSIVSIVDGVATITTQDFATQYRALRSFAGIAIPAGTNPVFNVVSEGTAGAPYNIMHLNIATEGGEIRGNAFVANTDGTLTANRDMFGISVCLNAVATFPGTDNVVVGIGIGDPTAIPTTPGTQVGENYVSRFRCAREGSGSGDEVTWDLNVQPVGKSTTMVEIYGVKLGDKIFPVIWTQEADDSSVTFNELIFTIEEISV